MLTSSLPPGIHLMAPPATLPPNCPIPGPKLPPSTPIPQARYTRYDDPRLQEAYARLVAALQEKTFPVYGKVFSDEDADKIGRQAIDAVRALPESHELRQRIECLIDPIVRASARAVVGQLLLGSFAFSLAGIAGYGLWRVYRR